jgi:flagellar motor switch protein FliG
MLTGKQKAQLLLSMLGDRSKSVLSLISPTHASLLTETIEESPKASSSVLNSLMNEIMQKVVLVRETGSLSEQKKTALETGFSLGGGFGMSFGEDDTASGETSVLEEETEPTQRLRTPDQIAALLNEQRPQLVAFVLSRLEEGLREEIQGYLSRAIVQKLSSLSVDAVPLSQQVFDNLYQEIFVLPPEEPDVNVSGLNTLDSTETEEPNRVFFF